MGFLSGMLKIILEHRAGPLDVLESIVSPAQSEIRDNRDSSENNNSIEVNNIPTKNYTGKCTSCGGTGEDSDKYEPLFDIYAPCGICHGEGWI